MNSNQQNGVDIDAFESEKNPKSHIIYGNPGAENNSTAFKVKIG